MLLETDAPFLSPEPLRSKPNSPGNVSLIGAYVARFLNIHIEKLAKITVRNTINLFSRIAYES